jgi:hypothetical protein
MYYRYRRVTACTVSPLHVVCASNVIFFVSLYYGYSEECLYFLMKFWSPLGVDPMVQQQG